MRSCHVRDKIMWRYDPELLGAPLWYMTQQEEGLWIQEVNAVVSQRRVFVCASELALDESLRAIGSSTSVNNAMARRAVDSRSECHGTAEAGLPCVRIEACIRWKPWSSAYEGCVPPREKSDRKYQCVSWRGLDYTKRRDFRGVIDPLLSLRESIGRKRDRGDDAVEPRRKFTRRFAEGIGKVAGNMPGDRRKKTIGLTARMPEAVGLGGSKFNFWLPKSEATSSL
ncbi:hypothetical protein BHM03_00025749 [Ensete ventricosum]|nr:hypothetical protein BHM03_00025749 [Ensete ventricosum]